MTSRIMIVAAVMCLARVASADPLTCNLTGYKAAAGLTAAVANDTLTLTWDGEGNQELQLRLSISSGTPTIRELSVRTKGAQTWATLASNVTPEFTVASGLRRATDQQIQPLRGSRRRDHLQGHRRDQVGGLLGRAPQRPRRECRARQCDASARRHCAPAGLPRQAREVKRAAAVYRAQSCDVKSNGGRIEVTFPGVELGVFAGRLEYQSTRARTDSAGRRGEDR